MVACWKFQEEVEAAVVAEGLDPGHFVDFEWALTTMVGFGEMTTNFQLDQHWQLDVLHRQPHRQLPLN